MTPLLLALLVLGPSADDDALAQATAAYDAQRWGEAAEAFGRAYEADPQPRFLYAQAQALRFDGDCSAAIDVYEAFIEVSASAESDAYATEAIEVCREELAAQPEPEPEPEPPPPIVEREPVAPPPTERISEPSPWYRDGLGHGLLWPGVALAAAGGAMMGVAQQQAQAADQRPSEAEYRSALENASVLNVAGVSSVAVGAALVVGGVVRFIVVSRRGERASTQALVVRF